MSKIIRAALYPRVSTEEQAIHGKSIDAQIDALKDFCEKNNMRIVDIYTDAGVSGGKAAFKRPGMSRLLEDVKNDKIDVVLFTKLDRWFRNIQEYFKVQEILDKHGVEWKAIHEDYDTMSANGRMAITIFLAIAQNEREKGAERVNGVLAKMRKDKVACFGGRMMPLGFKKANDTDGIPRLVIDPETEPVVRAFWSLIREGCSVMTAGKLTNEEFGISRAYKEWLHTFDNELYRGQYKGVVDFCPAYISNEEWACAAAKRTRRNPPKDRCYLFTGMVRCPECGVLLTSNVIIKKDSNREYYSYRCRHYNVRRCSFKYHLPELTTEKWLLENVAEKLEEFLSSAEVEAADPKPKPKRDKAKINEKIRRLNVIYMSGGKSDEEYSSELADLKAQLSAAELEEILTSDFETIYASLEREEKRRFWLSIVDHLVIEKNRVVDVVFKE